MRPRIEWRSFSGWCALVWLVDLGLLAWWVWTGPGPSAGGKLPAAYLGKIGGAAAVAFLLSFVMPIAMLDDSSHHRRAWWVAWLWPAVMGLMLTADVLAAGAAFLVRIRPLLESARLFH